MTDWKPPLLGNKQPRKYGPPDPRAKPRSAESEPPLREEREPPKSHKGKK